MNSFFIVFIFYKTILFTIYSFFIYSYSCCSYYALTCFLSLLLSFYFSCELCMPGAVQIKIIIIKMSEMLSEVAFPGS